MITTPMMTATWSTKVEYAGRHPRHSIARQALGVELRGRRRTDQAVVQCPQGGPYRIAGSTGVGPAAHLFWRSHEVRRAALGRGQNLPRDGSSRRAYAQRGSGIRGDRKAGTAVLFFAAARAGTCGFSAGICSDPAHAFRAQAGG